MYIHSVQRGAIISGHWPPGRKKLAEYLGGSLSVNLLLDFLLNLTGKEFWKPVSIWQRYRKSRTASVFFLNVASRLSLCATI